MDSECRRLNDTSPKCCVNYYDDNGVCRECPFGYYGVHCSQKCPENYYGRLCKFQCNCVDGFICQFDVGCVEDGNQTFILSGNSRKETKDMRTFGTLELLGTLAIGSLATIITLSLLIFFKKYLERRKTLTENVEAVVNLPRLHLRSDPRSTSGDLSVDGRDEDGAVGGLALVPCIKEGASRKSMNEYSTIDIFSEYHTLHSLALKRSFTSKVCHEVRKSQSLTDIDTFEIQSEQRQSILHIKTRSLDKNIGRSTSSFQKENKPALLFKNNTEKSLICDDQSTVVKQKIPLRGNGDETFETKNDPVMIGSNHSTEFGIDIESRGFTCQELSYTGENFSKVECNYSQLNSTRDEHLYGITRQRSLAKSTKKGNEEESQISVNILEAKTREVHRKGKGKVCFEYHDHDLSRSHGKTGCTDEENRCHDTLLGAEWNNDQITSEACNQNGNVTSTEGNFKDDKHAFSCTSSGKKSILTPFSKIKSKRSTERQLNANNKSRICQEVRAKDLEYEYGMNEETQDSKGEHDDHFRNKKSVFSSTIKPYSFVSKSKEIDVSIEELPSLKHKANEYQSRRPYSVVTKTNGKSRLGESEDNEHSQTHEEDGKNKPF